MDKVSNTQIVQLLNGIEREFHPTPRPSHPMLPRQQDDVVAAERFVQKLWTNGDSSYDFDAFFDSHQCIQHYYVRDILSQGDAPPINYQLLASFAVGRPLFLQGEVSGVGTSQLTTDWARACAAVAQREGIPRRVLKYRLIENVSNPRKFLEGLATAAGVTLTTADLRLRATETIALRVLAALYHANIGTVIIDHVRYAQDRMLDFIAQLVYLMNPVNRADLVGANGGGVGPIGVVLIDHLRPEVIFRRHPATLQSLQGCHALLRRHSTPEHVAEVMRQAGIGLEDIDLNRIEDRLMATTLLDRTDGLPAAMTPFLQRVQELARANRTRPTAEIFEAVMPYFRKMVALEMDGDARTGDPTTRLVVAEEPRKQQKAAEQPKRPLKPHEREQAQKLAKRESKQIRRSAAVSL